MEKDELMMKAATTVVAGVAVILFLMVILGWFALIIMSAVFIWTGITTAMKDIVLAVVEVSVGATGLVFAAFIALVYKEYM